MDPVTSAALIGAGAAGISTGGSIISNKKSRAAVRQNNEAQRNFSWDMYHKSRDDAYQARDYENWYNSPKQQMQRLKEAGLNPRLIYGGGTTGMMQSANTKGGDTSNPSTEAPTYDFRGVNQGLQMATSVMSDFMQNKKVEAQTDNIREQRELIQAQIDAVNAGVQLTGANTKMQEFNLTFAKGMVGKQHEQAQANIDKTRQEIASMDNEVNVRNAQLALQQAKNPYDIANILSQMESNKVQRLEALQRISHSKSDQQRIQQDIENAKQNLRLLQQDERIKKVHEDMYNKGMTPSDPAYARAFIEALGNFGKSDTSTSKQYKFEQNFKPQLKK